MVGRRRVGVTDRQRHRHLLILRWPPSARRARPGSRHPAARAARSGPGRRRFRRTAARSRPASAATRWSGSATAAVVRHDAARDGRGRVQVIVHVQPIARIAQLGETAGGRASHLAQRRLVQELYRRRRRGSTTRTPHRQPHAVCDTKRSGPRSHHSDGPSVGTGAGTGKDRAELRGESQAILGDWRFQDRASAPRTSTGRSPSGPSARARADLRQRRHRRSSDTSPAQARRRGCPGG